MNILVATHQGQGERDDDFCHATVGEMVVPGEECIGHDHKDDCVCLQSFIGCVSGKRTTTALVIDDQNMGIMEVGRAMRRRLEADAQTDGISERAMDSWIADDLATPDELASRGLIVRTITRGQHTREISHAWQPGNPGCGQAQKYARQ